jgi:FKBP-type peptidyl-prolyl cis-trans isomerase FkpA
MSNMRSLRFLAHRSPGHHPTAASLVAVCAGLAAGAAVAQAPAPAPAPAAPAAVTTSTAAPTAPAVGGSVTTSSGLVFKTLKAGTGASPTATDMVKVHYRGTFPDGKEFDSSFKRGQPAEFPLNRVIRCWTEGVQMMQVGGRAQLICPAAIAYGARGTPGGPIPPNATLHFEVELLGIAGR